MGVCTSTLPPPNPDEIDLTHFELLKVVGKGGFGKVNAVMNVNNRELFAMKRMEKFAVLSSSSHLRSVWMERKILSVTTECPFLLHLMSAFQSPTELFLVMPFMQGGDLRFHLRERGTMSESEAKFYAAEILLGLEHLHRNRIVYRDLKPENILLDAKGHARISDFGLASILQEKNGFKTTGQAGTRGYQAPEVIEDKYYSCEVDLWSFGITIYELLHGCRPWKDWRKVGRGNGGQSILLTSDLQSLLTEDDGDDKDESGAEKTFHISARLSSSTHAFLRALLAYSPKIRLGCGPYGIEDIKKHPFFADTKWEHMREQKLKGPIQPDITRANCSADADLADQLLDRKPRPISDEQQKNFRGWNFRTELTPKPEPIPRSPLTIASQIGSAKTALPKEASSPALIPMESSSKMDHAKEEGENKEEGEQKRKRVAPSFAHHRANESSLGFVFGGLSGASLPKPRSSLIVIPAGMSLSTNFPPRTPMAIQSPAQLSPAVLPSPNPADTLPMAISSVASNGQDMPLTPSVSAQLLAPYPLHGSSGNVSLVSSPTTSPNPRPAKEDPALFGPEHYDRGTIAEEKEQNDELAPTLPTSDTATSLGRRISSDDIILQMELPPPPPPEDDLHADLPPPPPEEQLNLTTPLPPPQELPPGGEKSTVLSDIAAAQQSLATNRVVAEHQRRITLKVINPVEAETAGTSNRAAAKSITSGDVTALPSTATHSPASINTNATNNTAPFEEQPTAEDEKRSTEAGDGNGKDELLLHNHLQQRSSASSSADASDRQALVPDIPQVQLSQLQLLLPSPSASSADEPAPKTDSATTISHELSA